MAKNVPDYLLPYTVKQDPTLYTPIDHAGWRFILQVSQPYFRRFAHPKYLSGLAETGISVERIPLIEEMDAKLGAFGWQAVAVSGFIPPAVFMEFLSLGILPIACDMRTLEHLAYTPAPDIVHEAAGHAPIIADRQYAAYLRTYGELARRVIFSSKDMDVYEAIRALSDIKEDPSSTPARIADAQKRLDEASAAADFVSEATELSRMGWWTIEYGLVGSLDDPKIYGAGLLSSLGESYTCLDPSVKKIPFTPECVHLTYDITRPQPQLFVARDFAELTSGLEELAKTMAFRLGGKTGLERAKQAATVTTVELDSGLQISGKVVDFSLDLNPDPAGAPCFFKMEGPVQLAFGDRELEGQGAGYHASGYSSPLGKIRSETPGVLEFESGIRLEGRPTRRISRGGRDVVRTFEECTITDVAHGGRKLYEPSWGPFDLACGERVVSVFGGAADRAPYLAATGGFHQEPGKPKTNLTPGNRRLNELYAEVRKLRESSRADALSALQAIESELEREHPEDWLLRYELLELDTRLKLGSPWIARVRARLSEISASDRHKGQMISRGLALL